MHEKHTVMEQKEKSIHRMSIQRLDEECLDDVHA